MKRQIRGNLGWFGSAGVCAVAIFGCGDSGAERASPSSEERIICPQCERAGGETSDFGEGSGYLPTGQGDIAPPTPCEESTQVVAIDVEPARALGFGSALDQLARSFELPFQWTAKEVTWGGPAAGYTPSTRISATTRVNSVEHLVPSLEGCEDTLRVQVGILLQTQDGALSIGGQLQTAVARSSQRAAMYGLLDLSEARGSLEVHPPSDVDSLVGFVQAAIYLWPDEARLSVDIVALEPQWIGTDTPGPSYEPLQGRAPVDACEPYWRPLDIDEPMDFAGGASVSLVFDELLGVIGVDQPKPARWSRGGDTSVTLAAGEPFDACDVTNAVEFKVRYQVASADGRVDIASDARGYMSLSDGVLGRSFLEIYPMEQVETAESFAANTGIAGVQFGAASGGFWHTELYIEPALEPALTGELTVEGVDIDGRSTGTPFAVLDVLDQLTW